MADKVTPFVYRRIGLRRQNYIFWIALSLLWLATKSNLYGDFLHAGKHPLLLIRALTSSRPIKRVYQMVRPTTLDNSYLQPQIEDGIIISDRSLIFAIRCAVFWGVPGTDYLLAIIDIAQLLEKFKQFSCLE